jgi:hypothetical protein
MSANSGEKSPSRSSEIADALESQNRTKKSSANENASASAISGSSSTTSSAGFVIRPLKFTPPVAIYAIHAELAVCI